MYQMYKERAMRVGVGWKWVGAEEMNMGMGVWVLKSEGDK